MSHPEMQSPADAERHPESSALKPPSSTPRRMEIGSPADAENHPESPALQPPSQVPSSTPRRMEIRLPNRLRQLLGRLRAAIPEIPPPSPVAEPVLQPVPAHVSRDVWLSEARWYSTYGISYAVHLIFPEMSLLTLLGFTALFQFLATYLIEPRWFGTWAIGYVVHLVFPEISGVELLGFIASFHCLAAVIHWSNCRILNSGQIPPDLSPLLPVTEPIPQVAVAGTTEDIWLCEARWYISAIVFFIIPETSVPRVLSGPVLIYLGYIKNKQTLDLAISGPQLVPQGALADAILTDAYRHWYTTWIYVYLTHFLYPEVSGLQVLAVIFLFQGLFGVYQKVVWWDPC